MAYRSLNTARLSSLSDRSLDDSSLSNQLLTSEFSSTLDPLRSTFGTASLMTPATLTDNTPATATNLGSLRSWLGVTDFVGTGDPIDYYSFSLARSGSVNVGLTGLSADADVVLYFDRNNNGAIEANEYVGGSFRFGNSPETLNLSNLSAGRYFLAVSQFSGSTNYSLQLSSNTRNNLLVPEFQVGTLSGSQTWLDFVGNTDTSDLYQFSLTTASTLNLALTGLSADADVRLIRDVNGNGLVDAGEILAESTSVGTAAEAISNLDLQAGNYFVQVYQYSGNTNYTLNLSALVNDNTPANAVNLGAIGTLTTRTGFVGASDTTDFYSFNLGAFSSLNVALTGVNGDADLHLYYDVNNNGVLESNELIGESVRVGNVAEDLNFSGLAAGRYFLQVEQYRGDTNYTLQLSNTTLNNLLGVTEAALGVLNGPWTISDRVDSADTSDLYQFSVTGNSELTLALTGLSSDADVRVIRDLNGNGVWDSGDTVASSTQFGTNSESLRELQLQTGSYFVQVYQASGGTNYNLSLATQPSDNTLAGAVNLNPLGTLTTRTGFVGSTDTLDYYRFDLTAFSSLNVGLTQLSSDADVSLYYDANNNGAIDSGEFVGGSFRWGTTSDNFNFSNLSAGRYFLGVQQFSGNTNYTLQLSTNWINNLIVPETQVGTLTGNRTFSGSINDRNTSDLYRFSVGSNGFFSLDLTGLSNDADVRLIRDTNGNGVVDAGETIASSARFGSAPEAIDLSLTAGDYLVQVYQYTGATNYTLQLSNTTTTPLPGGFSPVYGYGLVDASAAVAQAAGQTTPFPAVPNLGGNLWNLDQINAPEAWAQGFRGQGVVVAVVDTGVDYTHPDLDANLWRNLGETAGNGIDDDGNGYIDDIRGWDFVSWDNNPMDLGSHGTHVAGTIAAENNGVGMTGVAYDALIMPVRVLGPNGGTYSDVAAGIRYAVDNGADIINLSLGGGYSSLVADAVQYAAQNNVFVAMASGNEYYNVPGFPANLASQWGIAVGAVNSNKQVADFTNYAGPTLLDYVVAPGVNVYSTIPNASYAFYSGTSMATPHVAGVAALMLSANPSLTAAQVGDILTGTANPVGITV